jgi:hypothetical protein
VEENSGNPTTARLIFHRAFVAAPDGTPCAVFVLRDRKSFFGVNNFGANAWKLELALKLDSGIQIRITMGEHFFN